MTHYKSLGTALAVFLLALPATEAGAVLNAVDAGPYVAARGFFPVWYQDTMGRALDHCLSPATIVAGARPALAGGAALAGGPACTLLAKPGIFDPALALSFPANFPDESFWFMGSSRTTTGNGTTINYASQLEAAFNVGNPAPGGQVSFARIRINVTLPATAPIGTYTVTHPYGVEVIKVTTVGANAINFTRDVGIAEGGIFDGALAGEIGGFLVDASVPTLGPIPGFNARTGATELFIGDPNTARPATGSPFGTNFVRLEGPAGFTMVQNNLFNLMGKVYTDSTLPTPLRVERTAYSRNPVAGDQINVFAKAAPTSTTTFVDTVGQTRPMGSDSVGQHFGTSRVFNPGPGAAVPVASVAAGNTASFAAGTLVDVVTISRAEYSLSTGTLTVEASSSDETAVPALSLAGFGPLGAAGTTQSYSASGLALPPARVTVASTSGGSHTADVVILP